MSDLESAGGYQINIDEMDEPELEKFIADRAQEIERLEYELDHAEDELRDRQKENFVYVYENGVDGFRYYTEDYEIAFQDAVGYPFGEWEDMEDPDIDDDTEFVGEITIWHWDDDDE